MKIGIVTVYRMDNYGTKLQAYAMLKVLSKFSTETEIIDYYSKYDMRPLVLMKKVISKIKKNGCKYYDQACSSKDMEIRHKAITSFNTYYSLSKPVKGYRSLKKLVNQYDCFVCGSDQIWSEGNMVTDFFNFKFVKKRKPTIAYAPSFGTSYIKKAAQKKYVNFLNNINYLSVREDSGVDIIKALTGRAAALVVDPTILAGRDIWDELLSENKTSLQLPDNYVFCYFLGGFSEHRDYAQRVAEQKHCSLINLPHMKKYVKADEEICGIKLYDVTPIDFIRLIKNAKYVCTDSFHGTVFSILYEKTFWTFERFSENYEGSTNTRIYSLLDMLGIPDRLIRKTSCQIMENIPYDKVNENLEIMKRKSMIYLEEAIRDSCSKGDI